MKPQMMNWCFVRQIHHPIEVNEPNSAHDDLVDSMSISDLFLIAVNVVIPTLGGVVRSCTDV